MGETVVAQLKEIVVPVGALAVRMNVPLDADELPDRLTFWWGITSASVALAQHLESTEGLAGVSVLELGCGTGLAGVTAGLLGARVTFSDYVEGALEYARRNSRRNGLNESNTSFRILDWENPGYCDTFPVIIGAEVVYDYFSHGWLLNVLERFLSPQGKILLADRKRLCVSRFLGRMIDRGFVCEESASRVHLDGFPVQEIAIFTITRSNRARDAVS